ncbi:MAG: hypothetical protein K2G67_03680 [Muribaculaceae bacterium]|nr:hypothetical protein [Muribaculaceae bacterium]
MKRLLPALIAASMLVITSCSPTPQKIAEKMANGETLTEKEYTVVMDHSLDVVNEVNDSLIAHKGDFKAMVATLQAIVEANPETEIIITRLQKTDPTTLDEKNRALYEKLMAGVEEIGNTLAQEGPVYRTSDLKRIEPGVKLQENGATEPSSEEVKNAIEADSLSTKGTGAIEVLRP